MIRLLVLIILTAATGYTDQLRIATASGVQGPMRELVAAYLTDHPECDVQVIVGSSGKLTAQIMNGAPYDMFFSADMMYPQKLVEAGRAGSVHAYASGRLVLWASEFGQLELDSLTNSAIRHIAIANPRLAPYGRAAEEALLAAGLFESVKEKLVYAENVSQALHYIKSGAADAGLVALSLLNHDPELIDAPLSLIPLEFYQPVLHGYVAMVDSKKHKCVTAFESYMRSQASGRIFRSYGLSLSSENEVLQP